MSVLQHLRIRAAGFLANQEQALLERGQLVILYNLCLRASEVPLLTLSQLSQTNQGNASLLAWQPKTCNSKPTLLMSAASMHSDTFLALLEVLGSNFHSRDLAVYRKSHPAATCPATPLFPALAAMPTTSVSPALSRLWRRSVEGAGLQDEDCLPPSSHDARTSGVNNAQTLGAGDRGVQQMIGHLRSDEGGGNTTLFASYSQMVLPRAQQGAH